MAPTLYIAFAFMLGFGFIFFIQRRKLNMIKAMLRNGKITDDGKILIDPDHLDGIIPGISLETLTFEKKLKIVKRSGNKEDFQPKKVLKSCMACGVPKDSCEKIKSEVIKKAYDGMKTSEIRDIVLKNLKSEMPELEKKWKEYEKKKRSKS